MIILTSSSNTVYFQFAERKPEVEQEDELIYDAPPF